MIIYISMEVSAYNTVLKDSGWILLSMNAHLVMKIANVVMDLIMMIVTAVH
jgi:hypothetical protein